MGARLSIGMLRRELIPASQQSSHLPADDGADPIGDSAGQSLKGVCDKVDLSLFGIERRIVSFSGVNQKRLGGDFGTPAEFELKRSRVAL